MSVRVCCVLPAVIVKQVQRTNTADLEASLEHRPARVTLFVKD